MVVPAQVGHIAQLHKGRRWGNSGGIPPRRSKAARLREEPGRCCPARRRDTPARAHAGRLEEQRTISDLHRHVQAYTDFIVCGVNESVGRQISIYVRADDLELWRRAEAYARERRMPTSGLVMLALERYLGAEDSEARKGDLSR